MSLNLHILAGPNGAGKTTFANEFLPNYVGCLNFVNADLIAKGLAPFNPQSAGIKAGRLMLEPIIAYDEFGKIEIKNTRLYSKLQEQYLKPCNREKENQN